MKFELSDQDQQKVNKWQASLPDAKEGAIGGRISYCFTPTGIGVIVKVKDSVTNMELDLTDYDSW